MIRKKPPPAPAFQNSAWAAIPIGPFANCKIPACRRRAVARILPPDARASMRSATLRCPRRFSEIPPAPLPQFTFKFFFAQSRPALLFARLENFGEHPSAFGGGLPFGRTLPLDFLFQGADDEPAAAVAGRGDALQNPRGDFDADRGAAICHT